MNKIKFSQKIPGFKYLKNEKLYTLIPIEHLNELNLNESHYQTEVPIFFHPKTSKFVCFLCDDFFKSFDPQELHIPENTSSTCTELIENKKTLRFYANSIEELRTITNIHNDSTLKKLQAKYDQYRTDINKGEPVILACFSTNTSFKLTKDLASQLSDSILSSVTNGYETRFEFFKAYKFNNLFYLTNPDGTLNQKLFFKLDSNNPPDMNYLVLPYSESDWDTLNKINQRIQLIKNNLLTFFQNHQTNLTLDAPINTQEQLLLTKKPTP